MKTFSVIVVFIIVMSSLIETASTKIYAPKSAQQQLASRAVRFAKLAGTMIIVSSAPKACFAVKGSVGVSSLQDTKKAVQVISEARDSTIEMAKLADNSDFATIAKLINAQCFLQIEDAFTTLVRSDAVTAEDKVSLGTIKRYGVVADAIIMLGGLKAELRNGGFKIPEVASKDINSIEEDDDEDFDTPKPVLNPVEVKKYIKLSRDSLSDILRIGLPLLSK
jgi:hypothetical protein